MQKRVLTAILVLASGSTFAEQERAAILRSPQDSGVALSRDEALAVARKAAEAHGYDLARYELDTFPRSLSEDGSEWSFYYHCKPLPPPGCFFNVTVNRRTGASRVSKGE
jgi:hypothetical protein